MLATFRIVVLAGARQTGKTTLVRELLDLPPAARVTFDDDAVLARALDSPADYVGALPRPVAIDEFQRAGAPFLLAVKQAVDRSRSRGQFLLTGSANYLASRGVSDTLAGRVGRLELWPLSTGERLGTKETFLDRLWVDGPWQTPRTVMSRGEVMRLALEGGYPEVVTQQMTDRARVRWFDAYVDDVVSREALRPLVDVRLEGELRRVLRLLAARVGQELVVSDLAADSELDRTTVTGYVALLEALFLVKLLPPWATSMTSRAKRRHKIHLVDTGLICALTGTSERALSAVADGKAAGALLESFVVTELRKQATWADRVVDLAHFQDRNGGEIDVIVEDRRSGEVAGIEVKATSRPLAAHARHLAAARDRLGDRFVRGVLLHTGAAVLPLGDRLWAVPVSDLWA